MNECKRYIQGLHKEIKRLKLAVRNYKSLYHGLVPSDYIHVKVEDFNKVVERARKYDKLIKNDKARF